MSEPTPVSCQWDKCRQEFPTRDQLLLHITEEHIKSMKAMRKDEIIIMKKLDRAKFELDDIGQSPPTPFTPVFITSSASSTLELSAQSESAAPVAIQKPRSVRQPPSPADNLAAGTISEPPNIGTNGGPVPSSINGRFKRTRKFITLTDFTHITPNR